MLITVALVTVAGHGTTVARFVASTPSLIHMDNRHPTFTRAFVNCCANDVTPNNERYPSAVGNNNCY